MGKVAHTESKYLVNTDVKGTILGVRQIQDRGRVQIPKRIREKLNIVTGDLVYWVELGERIYLTKVVKIT